MVVFKKRGSLLKAVFSYFIKPGRDEQNTVFTGNVQIGNQRGYDRVGA